MLNSVRKLVKTLSDDDQQKLKSFIESEQNGGQGKAQERKEPAGIVQSAVKRPERRHIFPTQTQKAERNFIGKSSLYVKNVSDEVSACLTPRQMKREEQVQNVEGGNPDSMTDSTASDVRNAILQRYKSLRHYFMTKSKVSGVSGCEVLFLSDFQTQCKQFGLDGAAVTLYAKLGKKNASEEFFEFSEFMQLMDSTDAVGILSYFDRPQPDVEGIKLSEKRRFDHISHIFDQITESDPASVENRRKLKIIEEIVQKFYGSRVQSAREFYLLIEYKNADGSVPLAALTNTLLTKCGVELSEDETTLIGEMFGRKVGGKFDGCVTYEGIVNLLNSDNGKKEKGLEVNTLNTGFPMEKILRRVKSVILMQDLTPSEAFLLIDDNRDGVINASDISRAPCLRPLKLSREETNLFLKALGAHPDCQEVRAKHFVKAVGMELPILGTKSSSSPAYKFDRSNLLNNLEETIVRRHDSLRVAYVHMCKSNNTTNKGELSISFDDLCKQLHECFQITLSPQDKKKLSETMPDNVRFVDFFGAFRKAREDLWGGAPPTIVSAKQQPSTALRRERNCNKDHIMADNLLNFEST